MLKKNEIYFGTSNKNKVTEAAAILSLYGIKLLHYAIERVEIQSDDLNEIAVYSLKNINDNVPIVVEDAGLFINRLNGFPGPYSSYVLEHLGNPGILKLMDDVEERSAKYVSAVAYRDDEEVHVFQGIVEGNITLNIIGTNGFGFDPIFIPNEGDGRTFGEMSDVEKNSISHRSRAFNALGKWLTQ
jgi:XTP/dITP diphosphohydrolase